MVRIRAFRGLCPRKELASQVACVPYDVVDTAEAAALAKDNPYSLLHVDRAEIDCPPGTHIYDDIVYFTALRNFERLQMDGVLLREAEPGMFIYRLEMEGRGQDGLVAVCRVEDYEADIIKKHEKTRKDKEEDRTRLIRTLRANTGPVFLTYKDVSEVTSAVETFKQSEPLYDFVAVDGVRHTVWRVPGGGNFAELFAQIPCVYVADGHHRTASAARVGKELRESNPQHRGDEDYNWFLAVLFPASQLRIFPYNRIVRDLNGLSREQFLDLLRQKFEVRDEMPAQPPQQGWVSFYLGERWRGLHLVAPPSADPVQRLDVSLLQEQILAPILGIDDPRTSQRIDFVGGIRGTGELEAKVRQGHAAVAFSMFPTTVQDLMSIADAGQIMPPKSTWFEPKLRSGLFIHTF